VIERIRQRITELGRLAPLGLAALFLPILGSSLLIFFISPIGGWLRDHWQVGAVIMWSGIILFCGLSLLPTNVVGVVSGWAFGFPLGLMVLALGVVGASYVSFLLCTRISGDRLIAQLERHPRSKAIHSALLHESKLKATIIVMLLRLSVVMPFAFTNLLLAASRVPFSSFITGTAIGMLPRAIATSYIGSGLYELDLSNAEDTTVFIIGVIASIVSIVVIAVLSRKALERITDVSPGTE
jgi:uncharacterized membrane protein YdjX (TVP38/TMEM64 family)